MTKDIRLGDFCPFNNWRPATYEDLNFLPLIPWQIDLTTGRLYLDQDSDILRIKCFLVSLATPFYQTVRATIETAARIIFVLSGCTKHPFQDPPFPLPNTLRERAVLMLKESAKICALPVALISLELSALYGIFSPRNGSKLYATWERVLYQGPSLAPCFQPNANYHLFGGRLENRRGW